jgi:xylulokinase
MALLLGIDIGTSATKLVLADPDGSIVASAALPAGLLSPHPGWAEADPEAWWANVQAGVPEVLNRSGRRSEDVAALGVSGMVPTIVLLDAESRILRPSIQQNDARNEPEIESFRAATDEADILRRTGSAVTQQSLGPKFRWLRAHEPDVIRATRHVSGSYDFIVQRLTGAWSAERNWALESGLWDLTRGDWDDALLSLAGVPRTWLAPVRRPSDVVGTVTSRAAHATGLRAGTPVVAGSADHVASAFSAGVLRPGDLLVKLGSAGDILYCAAEPLVDRRLFLDHHLADGRFLPNGCMAASGSLLAWFRDAFAPGSSFAALDAEAAPLPPGADGLLVLPYVIGEKTPLFDPLARGTVVGLSLFHTRGHLFRAMLEGISFGFRHHLEVFSDLGPLPSRARCTNGGSDSMLWRQITADVLGLPLEHVADHGGSALGAAFAAGMGVGAFASWEDIGRFVSIGSVTEPDPDAHRRYEGIYPLFRDTYDRLRTLFPRLQQASRA